uniref:Transformer n=1 Tax=Panagrellus redivivus TaxID=6233 RepID=A0A7E4ZRI5_PANRE
MSSETGVEPALLIALNEAPESQSDAVAALSDILEGPPTTSQDTEQGSTTSEVVHQEAEEGCKTEQRKSPVQQIEADEKRQKRPRITYTPERDSHNKRRRSRSRSYERERYRRRSVDSRYRRRSRSRSRSRSPRRSHYRRSTPGRLRRASLKITDLLEGKYPLIPPPRGVNLRFEKEDLAEIQFGGGLSNVSF